MSKVLVAPSLLAADPLNLRDDVLSVKEAGADYLHLDIMDGHFVPNLSFSPDVAKHLVPLGLPLDIHLMVDCLDWAVQAFAPHARILTVHAEATPHLHRTLQLIRSLGCRAGVSLNPSTSPEVLSYILDVVDLVLVMTVNPGWGGQGFIGSMLGKIRRIRTLAQESGRDIDIQVDGGVTHENAMFLRDAGANILVAGSYVFQAQDRRGAMSRLRGST